VGRAESDGAGRAPDALPSDRAGGLDPLASEPARPATGPSSTSSELPPASSTTPPSGGGAEGRAGRTAGGAEAGSAPSSGAGPLRWQGRATVSPEVGARGPRRGRPVLLVLLVSGASFLLLCRSVIEQGLIALIFPAVVVIVVAAIASRWGFTRSLVSGAAKVATSAAGAALGTTAAAARSGGNSGPGRSVLITRLDVAGPSDVDVAVPDAGEGIRQGDQVRAVGPRMAGMVRPLLVVNESTGRRFVNLGLLRTGVLLAVLVAIPLVLLEAC
jgi:hypothetical protein